MEEILDFWMCSPILFSSVQTAVAIRSVHFTLMDVISLGMLEGNFLELGRKVQLDAGGER